MRRGPGGEQVPERLVVVSHVVHYRRGERVFAYAAYAREIDVWAELFDEVLIAAPCQDESPPADCAPLLRPNIRIMPQPETGGDTIWLKLKQVALTPYLVYRLGRAMRGADAIHVRCPGNLGLLGALVAPLAARCLVAKFAGSWAGYPEEPWSFRFQRWLLRSRWWRGPVTVYGEWPDQPDHIIPFFTSVMTGDQVAHARAASGRRAIASPLRVLFVGRLAPKKNVDVLISAVAQLRAKRVALECVIIGDGVDRASLERQACELGVGEAVLFTGGLPFDQVQLWYQRADVLVLASDAEGWPKAIAEAMAYGLVCIGSDRGFMVRMLGEGRGVLVQPRDLGQLAEALTQICVAPEEFESMRARAAEWAQRYSLEGLRDALAALLAEHWHVRLLGPTDPKERPAREGGA